MPTVKIYEFESCYQRGRTANVLKTSQRDGSSLAMPIDHSPLGTPSGDDKGISVNRSRSGRRMADDASPVQVLNRDVKATLFAVARENVIRLTFRLAHETMGPKRRRSVETNLRTWKAKCDRYGKQSTDSLERLREPFRPSKG